MFPLYLGLGKALSRPYPAEAMMFTLPNATGSHDITLPPEVGKGETPIAAYFVQGDDGPTYQVSVGAFDGTNQWYIANRDKNGKSTTVANHTAGTTNCMVKFYDQNQLAVSAVSLIPNGVRVNITTAQAATGQVVFFFDDEGQAQAGNYSAASVGSSATITTGFTTDAVISSFSRLNVFSGGNSAHTSANIGFAIANGNQASVGHASRSNESTSQMLGFVRDDGGALSMNRAGSPQDGWIQYQNFTSISFDAKTINNAMERGGYLALHMPNAQFDCGVYTTPTSTGKDVHNTGFPAQTTLFGVNTLEAVNTQKTDSTSESVGLGVGVHDAENLTVRVASRDNASPASSTETVVESGDITAAKESSRPSPEPTNANQYKAVTSGWRLNFTAAPVARQWPYLSIGAK